VGDRPGGHAPELSGLRRYLAARAGAPVDIRKVQLLEGGATGTVALKQFGYGRPLLVDYRVGERRVREVLHRIRRNAFGRERAEDRVAAVWLDHRTFNCLPRHVPAVDVVAHANGGEMASIGWADELLLVTAYRPGHVYADDLVRIRDEGTMQPLDVERAEALAAYLAEIHRVAHDDETLWRRRLRDLVGHGEGVMGLTDSYPPDLPYVSAEELRAFEEAANRWRWRLKPLSHRLRQVHGDFHPFNVLFAEGLDFHVLDRSRGAWGEPADDMSCMTINYLFFSLQRCGRLEGPFAALHEQFWARYLTVRPDEELMSVIQPWLAWRVLVLASPVWYPTISEEVRCKLLTYGRRVLASERYDPHQVNRYLAPD
jgi:aminoglycoside phosphotransferase (APT) family kinase protein